MSKVGACVRCGEPHQTLYYCRSCREYVCGHCGLQMPEDPSFKCHRCRKKLEPPAKLDPKLEALVAWKQEHPKRAEVIESIAKLVAAHVITNDALDELDALIGSLQKIELKPYTPPAIETSPLDLLIIDRCNDCPYCWMSACTHPRLQADDTYIRTAEVADFCPLRERPALLKLKETPCPSSSPATS
jgi:succinate dehydrogenase/fumarate reductase-like Fe-S protein